MSDSPVFFDTNVLLYIYSDAYPAKQARALTLYRQHARVGRLLLSTQVVQEFFVAGVRKLMLPATYVREIALTLLESPLITIEAQHIRLAIGNVDRYGISFWDALILAAAEFGGATVLYMEDLSHGQQYGTVLVLNPFHQS